MPDLGGDRETDSHLEQKRESLVYISQVSASSSTMSWKIAWKKMKMEADPTLVFVGWFPHLDRLMVSLTTLFLGM